MCFGLLIFTASISFQITPGSADPSQALIAALQAQLQSNCGRTLQINTTLQDGTPAGYSEIFRSSSGEEFRVYTEIDVQMANGESRIWALEYLLRFTDPIQAKEVLGIEDGERKPIGKPTLRTIPTAIWPLDGSASDVFRGNGSFFGLIRHFGGFIDVHADLHRAGVSTRSTADGFELTHDRSGIRFVFDRDRRLIRISTSAAYTREDGSRYAVATQLIPQRNESDQFTGFLLSDDASRKDRPVLHQIKDLINTDDNIRAFIKVTIKNGQPVRSNTQEASFLEYHDGNLVKVIDVHPETDHLSESNSELTDASDADGQYSDDLNSRETAVHREIYSFAAVATVVALSILLVACSFLVFHRSKRLTRDS